MLELTPNNPIVNAGLLYVNGLQIANTAPSVKTLFINYGFCRDSKNINDIKLSSSTIVNGLQVGANGVDLAPLIANRIYAVYVIGDSTNYRQTAGLFSLQSITPTLPVGYDMFRRIGWILTDSSANIVSFVQLGVNENRTYYYQVPKTVLVAGASNIYALVDLSSVVPPITQFGITATIEVFLNLLYTQASPANFVQFHYGILSPVPPGIVLFSGGATTIIPGTVTVPSQVQKIAYRVGAGDNLTINLTGYTDYLY